MEAMACGTPVIALRRGAFPEIVDDGVTGFLVGAPDEMAEAMRRVHSISPEACRRRVERQFSARRMAAEYNRLYRRVLQAAAGRSVA
jgi:glycosyltransferase involved in cell wall biosynthesis